MKYRLKRGFPPFEMVDGPFARKKYQRGRTYEQTEIPPEYEGRFEPASKAELKSEPKKEKTKEVKKEKPGYMANFETPGKEN